MITVVICTFNRAEVVKKTIESLLDQTFSRKLYEIVVIDDGSRDNTENVVLHFQKENKLPQIRYIQKKKNIGLAHSRNLVVKQSKDAYIAFIDDDALACSDWLKEALETFAKIKPTPQAVTGPVLPYYPSGKPGWFKDSYEEDVKGQTARFLTKGETFTGANMIFRRDVILQYGGFDERIDMKGEDLILGEETSFFERMWMQNPDETYLYYSPKVFVNHMIHPYKMTVLYKLKRWYAAGQSHHFRHAGHAGEKVLMSIQVIAYLFILVLTAPFLFFRYRYYQNWMIERVGPTCFAVGYLSALFGIKSTMKHANRL